MKKADAEKQRSTKPDYRLMLKALEKEIITKDSPDRALKILKQASYRQAMPVDGQLKWAELAQLAGNVDITLNTYEDLHRSYPDNRDVWLRHLELCCVLNRPGEMVKVLRRAARVMDRDTLAPWLSKYNALSSVEQKHDIDSASVPFKELRTMESLIDRFMKLFSGRQDCFARQWADKKLDKQGYVPVRHPMTPGDAADHLNGRITYGIYLMRSDSTVKTAVVDVDLIKSFRSKRLTSDQRRTVYRESNYLTERIPSVSAEKNLYPLMEISGGKGYHFWYFFDPAIAASVARNLLESIVAAIRSDLTAFNMEVFPKQDQLKGKGLGNLVKLPLGIHRKTGKRSIFPQCRNRDIREQLEFLKTVRISEPATISEKQKENKASVVTHPRFEKWAADYPELHSLETHCPPLGQIISICLNSGTLSMKEEKILFQTVGFLRRKKTLIHYLCGFSSDYNPHAVDYRLSRIRGMPLGCRRIHSLLNFEGDYCRFDTDEKYIHPILHVEPSFREQNTICEQTNNLAEALEQLTTAIGQVRRFL